MSDLFYLSFVIKFCRYQNYSFWVSMFLRHQMTVYILCSTQYYKANIRVNLRLHFDTTVIHITAYQKS
jgi:hypothetical protein